MRDAVIFRVAMWASAGLLISAGWGVYFASLNKTLPIEPIVYTLAALTQPTVGVALYFKLVHRVGLTGVLVANAATYALFGLIAETIRQHYRSPRISN
jgi:hypothetical protein